jgi:Transcriptional regulators
MSKWPAAGPSAPPPRGGDALPYQAAHLERMLPEIALRLFTLDPEHPLADLPQAQMKVCVLLFQNGPRTLSQISDTLGISASAVTQIADRLEKAGMVERAAVEPGEGDRRARYLELTEQGRTLMEQRRQARVAKVAAALEHLSPHEREWVEGAVTALLRACQTGSHGE